MKLKPKTIRSADLRSVLNKLNSEKITFSKAAQELGDIAEQRLLLLNVSGSLREHKQVITDLLITYIYDLDENGSPKKSITEIMQLIDRATKLVVGNDR